MTKEKKILRTANILSSVFSPFYAPTWAFIVLFTASYLRLLPSPYKTLVLTVVVVFTIVIPRLGIRLFSVFYKLPFWHLSHREHRHMPYILTLLSYLTCMFLMSSYNVPSCMRGIILASLIAQIICMLINVWWKISTHSVAAGGLIGALVAFSFIFSFNPVWPLCLLILMAGVLGSSRMILRQHSLSQVMAGYTVGFACGLVFVLIS